MDKIAVIGLGPSWTLYNPEDIPFSIGVNDAWRNVKTNVVVCVDEKHRFAPDRLKIIEDCTPEAFISQLPDWKSRQNYHKIDLLPYYPDHVCQINLHDYPMSLCSPFVASVVAYKMFAAKEIHLFGVDLTSHPNLDREMCERIKRHFKNLKIALRQNGSNLIVHGEGILKNI